MKKRTIISLFSGGGGLDIGFHSKGFHNAVCVESNPIMCETLKLNNLSDNIICDEIQNVTNEVLLSKTNLKEHEADIVLGGPPCPAFSKSRFYRKEMTHGTDDPSFQTVKEYFRVVECFKPKMFVFENVHTFAAKRQKGALEYVLETGNKLGYKVKYQILNAADYGVPQKRERIIIVGTKGDSEFNFPSPTHRNPDKFDKDNQHLPIWKTAGEAISDLDSPENDAKLPGHFAGGKDHDLLYDIPPGQNYLFYTEKRGHPNPKFKWRSRYWSFLLKLSPDLPSWTIQARRSNNMGPLHWRNRILTIDEVKRLQTFPDDYQLSGSTENQWRQIGNAVSPLLAEAIAHEVNITLDSYSKKQKLDCESQLKLEIA
ncbi:DNA cytosine methyltransferase [Thalassotalea euphylliae]|uniref:Cytosine-specific methyltransferase n=1 Tax=Thalassotalea euphylliae TaxID=1655234 RepID=A0A3E0UD94_9GAMM|nr:DNA cytosine methyltransferase [Thalassotalea euphylliae]REL34684.1 DNA cytosine methyltransferase [Thalassotalea euphylliae]